MAYEYIAQLVSTVPLITGVIAVDLLVSTGSYLFVFFYRDVFVSSALAYFVTTGWMSWEGENVRAPSST